MRFSALFLSLIVVTWVAAQKPLDRGIHKRKTGGMSFLFGNNAYKAEGHAEANAFGDLVVLENLPPAALPLPTYSPQLLMQSTRMESVGIARANRPCAKVRQRMSVLPSRRVESLAGPAMNRRLFRCSTPAISRTRQGSDSLDWVSLLAMLFATLGLVALGFSLGWWGGFWGLADTFVLWFLTSGFLLGFLGLRRTKRGKRRGGILALIGFIVGAILPSTAVIVLIALLTGNFSIPF